MYTCRKIVGSEDCLYLNVYTSAAASPSALGENGARLLLPVLFWVHGGAYRSGSGEDDWLGPRRAMDLPLVLVTLNYRLGALGHLATRDGAIQGNQALKDQVMVAAAAAGKKPFASTLL